MSSLFAGFAVGYYSVLGVLTVPLVWVYRVVAAGRPRWRAVVVGALFTAASLSGFLQGFVLFLSLPIEPARRLVESLAPNEPLLFEAGEAGVIRLVASWDSQIEDVDHFLASLNRAIGETEIV